MTTMTPNAALAKAEIALPRFDWNDENKRKYLSYRLCGFTRAESAERAEISIRTVTNWISKDSAFADIETRNLLELRKEVAKEVIALDFTRNFKLVLDLDERLLKKAVSTPSLMTRDDQAYLKTIRPLYTPQQLAVVEAFFEDTKDDQSFDELILLARKRRPVNAGVAQRDYTDETQCIEAEYNKGTVIEGRFTGGEEET